MRTLMQRRNRGGPRARLAAVTAVAFLATLTTLVSGGGASAAPGDVGYSDMSYGSPAGSGFVNPDLSPTASKPQSKLWFAQGEWWGVLNNKSSNNLHMYRLNQTTQQWVDSGVVVDSRSGALSDVLWDGTHLFIASHQRSGSSANNGVQISRYSFVSGSYVRDSGFPTTINTGGVEEATIAKDSTGRLWATWTQSSRVRVAVSAVGGQSWGAPFIPNVAGTSVTSDDISTIESYDGQISVVWSNQNDGTVYAATHVDGAATTTWQLSRKVVSGPNEADDHINLKSIEGDSAGRLYAVVKTSLNDVSGNGTAPLINLLVLGVDDVWRKYTAWRVQDGVTRAIVVLDSTNRMVRLFAAGPETGGVVYTKQAPMGNVSFPTGKGDPFIKLASDKNINNPTSTKQSVNATSGLVILASDQVTARYVHNTMSLGTPPPPVAPVAAFSGTPLSGTAPLNVGFTDQSSGSPTSWSWDFGDGGTATTANPSHTYSTAGTYDVSLTATNAGGSNTVVKTGYVTVGDPPPPVAPVAAFSGTPLSGTAPLNVGFTDQSSGSPTSWSWDFGDGGTATTANPSHTYSTAGTYDVSLTATNTSGSNTVVKTGYVTVGDQPPPATDYRSTVVADNPVGYWRLGDPGTSVAAELGPSGSTVGGVSSAPGAIVNDPDTARAFDGSTGYLSVPSAASLNPTGDLSVEAWVNPRVVHSGVAVQKGGASGYSVWQYRLGMTSGGQWRGTVFVGSTAYAVTAPGTGALGAWTHLVLTRSAGTLSLYVNGSLAATATSSGALNTTTSILGIGRSGASATSYFDGSIDEVAVYGHALSAAAVAAHKNGGRP